MSAKLSLVSSRVGYFALDKSKPFGTGRVEAKSPRQKELERLVEQCVKASREGQTEVRLKTKERLSEITLGGIYNAMLMLNTEVEVVDRLRVLLNESQFDLSSYTPAVPKANPTLLEIVDYAKYCRAVLAKEGVAKSYQDVSRLNDVCFVVKGLEEGYKVNVIGTYFRIHEDQLEQAVLSAACYGRAKYEDS